MKSDLETLETLIAENEELKAILRRVRCYAIVDPMGNPGLVCAHRMRGLERDVDEALGDPPASRSETGARLRAIADRIGPNGTYFERRILSICDSLLASLDEIERIKRRCSPPE